MEIFYYIFCVIEFARISVISIKIIIDIFSFNFIFKTGLKGFRI